MGTIVAMMLPYTAGAVLVGYRPENLVDVYSEAAKVPWGGWASWAGVLVFSMGVYFHFSAPRNSLRWMLLVLLLAFAAQQAAGVFGSVGSGFFGMFVITPLGYLIQLRFKGPPAMVTFLPSFWLLVPGALGLLCVKHMISDHTAGVDALVTAIFVFASIALGTLMGASIYKTLTEWFGAWQLQIGRVGDTSGATTCDSRYQFPLSVPALRRTIFHGLD